MRTIHMKEIQRVVVKLGTSTLTHGTGLINIERIESIIRQLADLHNMGYEIIIVTSGAIGAGVGRLSMKERPKNMPEKQAAAAVGQSVLLHMYQKIFSEYGKITGQILLTRNDISDRKRFINARNTFNALLGLNVIPIVNENDAVVVDEIKVGDNDTLSAYVAALIEADLLILLSDIDGLYDGDPRTKPDAQLIHEVQEITHEIRALAGGAGSSLGTGGMHTKIKAADIATAGGCSMIIANGASDNILRRVLKGEAVGTLFLPKANALPLKKHWIGFESKSKGHVIIDSGAESALRLGKSLLPVGLKHLTGSFSAGDTVTIMSEDDRVIGYGITYYSHGQLKKIAGVKSSAIEETLGYKDYDEVIHASNLIITG